jgi:hypothetical protein
MTAKVPPTGTTAAEQMFFAGAPLAHVVLYYELQRTKRIVRRLTVSGAGQQRQLIAWLEAQQRRRELWAHLRSEFAEFMPRSPLRS